MKYKIVNYDHNRLVIDFQVIESEDPEVLSAVYPMSVEGITTVERMEKAIYDTWYRNLSPLARADYSAQVLAHVTEFLGEVCSSEIQNDTINRAQMANQDTAIQDTTSTVTIRII